jgi:hypothetical protein
VLDEIARRLLEKEVLEEAELRALLANVPREELDRIVARAGANANGHASVPTGEERPWTIAPQEPSPASTG